MKKILLKAATVIVMSAAFVAVGTIEKASALTFETAPYLQYGDFHSYALGLLNYLDTGNEKGNNTIDWSIASTPGQIKDEIVLYTDPGGGDLVNNESPNINDAFGSVSGTDATNYFFSTSLAQFPDPGVNGTGTGDVTGGTSETWDIQIDAMQDFLDGANAIFYFNNNQEGKSLTDISLYAYGLVQLIDLDGGATPLYFEFANNQGVGGIPLGDVTAYSYDGSEVIQPNDADMPVSPDMNHEDYVFVRGELCFTAAADLKDCSTFSSQDGDFKINANLGARQASYAIWSPELQAILNNPDTPYDILRADFRLGNLNNGFEQLFMVAVDQNAPPPPPIPEPSTFALVGLGIAGVAFLSRRKKNS